MSSLEANVHKRRVAYDLDIEEERLEAQMTEEDHKLRMNKDLCKKIDDDVRATGIQICKDDINTLLVKQDAKVDYGLKITKRKHQKM